MTTKMQGKALIVGATGGMGSATALALAGAGVDVGTDEDTGSLASGRGRCWGFSISGAGTVATVAAPCVAEPEDKAMFDSAMPLSGKRLQDRRPNRRQTSRTAATTASSSSGVMPGKIGRLTVRRQTSEATGRWSGRQP